MFTTCLVWLVLQCIDWTLEISLQQALSHNNLQLNSCFTSAQPRQQHMQYLHVKGEHHKGNVSSLQVKQQGLRRKAFECQMKLYATVITMPVRADGGSLLTQGPSQILVYYPSVPACTNHATAVCPACCVRVSIDICELVAFYSHVSTCLSDYCCFRSNGCLARPHQQRFHLVRAQVLPPCKHPLMSSSPA